MSFPRFRPVAEHALLVEFAETLDDDAHRAVLRLDRALTGDPFPGLREAVPAYVSLLAEFDPVETDHAAAEAHLRRLVDTGEEADLPFATREILVCYDADLAPDLAEVATRTGLDSEAVIAAHLAGDYRVFMYGFAPGYAYLGGVPEAIRLPRKPTAVRGVPAGAVLIAGAQGLVSTITMPTGWWIIGRSPTRVLTGDPARPFLFDVGDRVRFRRIGRAEFDAAGGAA